MRERIRETVRMFEAVVRRDYIILKRYPVNTLGGILGSFLFFLMLFYGGRAIGGDRFDESLGALVVAYFLVTMAITSYRSLANRITSEAQWGTLERIYTSPVGFGRVMSMMAMSAVLFSFVWGGLTLALMLAVTGKSLSIPVVSVAVVVVISLLTTLGVGLVFGGAAVRFKRVSNVFNLLQFAFFGFVVAPVEQNPLLKALPLAQGSYLLQQVMDEGVRIWELPPTEVGILLGVGVAYFLTGYVVFQLLTDWSRRAGVMGHY